MTFFVRLSRTTLSRFKLREIEQYASNFLKFFCLSLIVEQVAVAWEAPLVV
jgi:hypothetical protein